ncbi:hypothetical protein [Burkholderia sp. WAC0059]|uniref:hypothetical protein n=1 Tax=Burkholderia sp. WAC0059 TaxID=2066022 RepID=UPI0015E11037|nr:hypothetical protein [Burkholderia sp. WAC0059]
MNQPTVVPEDFPRDLYRGALAGSQPKLLLRKIAGKYYAGLTDEELWARYKICEDMAQHLSTYVTGKIAEGWEQEAAMRRLERAVANKVYMLEWDFSVLEVAWLMRRVRETLGFPPLLDEPTGEVPGVQRISTGTYSGPDMNTPTAVELFLSQPQRIGVAKGRFETSDDIDAFNEEVAAMFRGDTPNHDTGGPEKAR